MNNYVIGNVISISGTKINILMREQSNLEYFHYDGVIYDGISVGSYIGIIRGSNKIIARVEKEFLEDMDNDPSIQEFSRNRFKRYLEVSLVGNIYRSKFHFGVKIFPMIFNEVVLLNKHEIDSIIQQNQDSAYKIPIGKSVHNNNFVNISWNNLFNTHMAILGNTGSGKSNTLTKLYTELFKKDGIEIKKNFDGKSKFIILDFNGEYIKKGILHNDKRCIELSTQDFQGDKLPLDKSVFWDPETLSILYSATEKTQKPFLTKAINSFLDKSINDITIEKIITALISSFDNVFMLNNNKDTLELLNKSLSLIKFDEIYEKLEEKNFKKYWLNSRWHSSQNTYYIKDTKNEIYFNNSNVINEISNQKNYFKKLLYKSEFTYIFENLSITSKLLIIINSYLIYSLSYGMINFEHISPLIRRIESRESFVEKTIFLSDNFIEDKLVSVISFKRCNSIAKKLLPLLIVRQLYENHKKKINSEFEITTTIHLIIDEAHNILSSQSNREEASWKDYRLEVFEEIIKEGRKFGFYITLSSQRPYDISPTILSQVHNFFIHRLVNENDLKIISNTVTSLDSVSKSQIPTLAPGQCIITGTSFNMPLLIQVEKLIKEESPTSENADLISLWT